MMNYFIHQVKRRDEPMLFNIGSIFELGDEQDQQNTELNQGLHDDVKPALLHKTRSMSYRKLTGTIAVVAIMIAWLLVE